MGPGGANFPAGRGALSGLAWLRSGAAWHSSDSQQWLRGQIHCFLPAWLWVGEGSGGARGELPASQLSVTLRGPGHLSRPCPITHLSAWQPQTGQRPAKPYHGFSGENEAGLGGRGKRTCTPWQVAWQGGDSEVVKQLLTW